MFNPFGSRKTPDNNTPSEISPDNALETLDRRKIGENIRRLTTLGTLALASLFAPQTAKAADEVSGVPEATLTAAASPENIIETEAYQAMVTAGIEIQQALSENPEVTKTLDDILTILPEDEYQNEEPAYFDTGDGDTYTKDPFVNTKQLDLTLKKLENPSVFNAAQLEPKINSLSKAFTSDKVEESFQKLQDNIKVLEPIFASRPEYSLVKDTSKSNEEGHIFNGGKYMGWGTLTTKTTNTRINTLPGQYGSKDSVIGNKEIYEVMSALRPLGKELGKRFSTMVGCDEQTVEVNTNLLSSVHFDENNRVNKTPYNNVHPTYTIEVCKKKYTLITGTTLTTTPFLSLFNNSNGFGGGDLNKVRQTKEYNVHIADGYHPNVDKTTTELEKQLIPSTNRLIVTAGIKVDIPIANTNFNLEPKLGLQYGYTVDGKNISPMVSISFVYKKEGSPLNGLEIGLLPAGTKVGNSPKVLYFSTQYSMKF